MVEKLRAIFLMRDLIIITSVTYIGPSIILQLSYDNYFIGFTSVDSHPHRWKLSSPNQPRRHVGSES